MLTLSTALESAELDLDVFGSSIESRGGGADFSIKFYALPGDTDNSGFVVNTSDVLDVVGRQGSLIFAGGGVFDVGDGYSFRADLDGNNVVNSDDVFAARDRVNSLLLPPSRPGPGSRPASGPPSGDGMGLLSSPWTWEGPSWNDADKWSRELAGAQEIKPLDATELDRSWVADAAFAELDVEELSDAADSILAELER